MSPLSIILVVCLSCCCQAVREARLLYWPDGSLYNSQFTVRRNDHRPIQQEYSSPQYHQYGSRLPPNRNGGGFSVRFPESSSSDRRQENSMIFFPGQGPLPTASKSPSFRPPRESTTTASTTTTTSATTTTTRKPYYSTKKPYYSTKKPYYSTKRPILSNEIPTTQPTPVQKEFDCGKRPNIRLPSMDPFYHPFYRIHLGYDAEENSWPWIAAIGRTTRNRFVVECGGTLITDRHVLTAAHCFLGFKMKPFTVRLGEHDVTSYSDNAVDYRINQYIMHEDFNPRTADNDIAIVLLDRPVNFTEHQHIRPACLPTNYIQSPFERGYLIGWGREHYSNGIYDPGTNTLQESRVTIIDNAECRYEYVGVKGFTVRNSNICAGDDLGASCDGDSGGPLLVLHKGRYTVVGVVSFGVQCGLRPSVHTRVTSYLSWIFENIRKLEQKY